MWNFGAVVQVGSEYLSFWVSTDWGRRTIVSTARFGGKIVLGDGLELA